MKPLSIGRFPRGLLLIWVVIATFGLGRAQPDTSSSPDYTAMPACGPAPGRSPRIFPSLDLSCAGHIEYLGLYAADGKYRAVPLFSHSHKARDSALVGQNLRFAEVPKFVNLHPRERVLENYEPPARAAQSAKRASFLAALRDHIVTLAYGREKILLAPQRVTTDSRGRVIVVDAGTASVHVLDGKHSFRFAGGPYRRLHQPSGVAVDAEDNIYVTDPSRGIVVVYDADGRFVRYLGKLGNETLFHYPTAIAIDRKNARLYLLDSPRHVLFMLDLQGNILKRVGKQTRNTIGKPSGSSLSVDFDNPTEIALGNDQVVVLDAAGSRLHVMDLQCNPVKEFSIRAVTGREIRKETGLGVDADGNIFVSNFDDSAVRIYDRHGHFLSSFGTTGVEAGELNSPAGLWIDSANRMYIADTNNSRVQVFQLSPSSPDPSPLSK